MSPLRSHRPPNKPPARDGRSARRRTARRTRPRRLSDRPRRNRAAWSARTRSRLRTSCRAPAWRRGRNRPIARCRWSRRLAGSPIFRHARSDRGRSASGCRPWRWPRNRAQSRIRSELRRIFRRFRPFSAPNPWKKGQSCLVSSEETCY